MAVAADISADRSSEAALQPPRRTIGPWLRCWALSAIPLLGLLLIVVLRKSRYFWIGDTEAQYAATFHYIGEQLSSGNIPWMVPWQGSSANLLLDPQYGMLNPLMWVHYIAYAASSDLQLASIALSALGLVLVQGGAIAWLMRLGVGGGWAVLGGFTSATGGYLLSSDSSLVLLSLAALAWLGWALAAPVRSVWQVLAVAVTTFAALAGGAPFVAVSACLLIAAAVGEAWAFEGMRTSLRLLLAAAGGAALAAPNLVLTAFAFQWTLRQGGIENTALYVPGLADVLNTGNATAGVNLQHATGSVGWGMLVVVGGLGLAVVPFIDLPARWWRHRSAITLTTTVLGLLVLMQGPSEFGPLRWPVRYLGAYQLLLSVTLVAAFGIFGVRVSRARIAWAVTLWAAFAFITFARSPQFLPQHVLSIALAGALVAVFALVGARAIPWLSLPLCFLIMLWAMFGQPGSPRVAAWGQPTNVADYQLPLGAGPERSLVLVPPEMNMTAAALQGVFTGQNYLVGPARSGVGYSSVGQRYAAERFCTHIGGFTCPAGVANMLQVEPSTGRRWIDLLGVNTLVAHRGFIPALDQGLPDVWNQTQATKDFVVLRRPAEPQLVGRISTLPEGAQAKAIEIRDTMQSYSIDSTGGRVVFADVFWPGYGAEWNGEPVPVTALGNVLVAVDIPPGAGTLTVTYRPAGATIAAGFVGLGLLLTLWALIAVRRQRGERVGAAAPVGSAAAN